MEPSRTSHPPGRITDIAAARQRGERVTCRAEFEVVPVDFIQRDNPYQAHVFLCRYSGDIGGAPYAFRKCYARGCPHNLCPHVSQAVMIANRHLQRDYRTLRNAGIAMEEKLFSLDDMVVKFEDFHESHGPLMTIDDYVNMAGEGTAVSVGVELEYLPAVEHFGNYQNSQTFLNGTFHVTALGGTHPMQRCFACFPTDKEAEEKPVSVNIANKRLSILYKTFDDVGVQYGKVFFE